MSARNLSFRKADHGGIMVEGTEQDLRAAGLIAPDENPPKGRGGHYETRIPLRRVWSACDGRLIIDQDSRRSVSMLADGRLRIRGATIGAAKAMTLSRRSWVASPERSNDENPHTQR